MMKKGQWKGITSEENVLGLPVKSMFALPFPGTCKLKLEWAQSQRRIGIITYIYYLYPTLDLGVKLNILTNIRRFTCCHSQTERGDHDFFLDRSHYTNTDPTKPVKAEVESMSS